MAEDEGGGGQARKLTGFQEAIVSFMLKENPSFDQELSDEIPKSYEKFGNTVLFSEPCFGSQVWNDAGAPLWETICRVLKVDKVAIKGKILSDGYRSPTARLVYGTSPLVHCIDNGIKYSWNLEKSMFCSGNASERHRLAKIDCSNEIVVDLFAGIGYFTLPFLVHSKAKFVHACEWNPYSVEMLKKNLEANKVKELCAVYDGDNRQVCPRRIGHRVNLGLIPSSSEYLRTATEVLLPSGGTLHVHENVTSRMSKCSWESCSECVQIARTLNFTFEEPCVLPLIEIGSTGAKFCVRQISWKRKEWLWFSFHLSHTILFHLKTVHSTDWKVTVTNLHKVKSYAPHVDHLVYDVLCQPCPA